MRLLIQLLLIGRAFTQVVQEWGISSNSSHHFIVEFHQDYEIAFTTAATFEKDPSYNRYINVYLNMLRGNFDFTTKNFFRLTSAGDIGCRPASSPLPFAYHDPGLEEAANFHCQEMTQNPNCFQHNTCSENCHQFGGDCSFGKRTWSFYKKQVMIGENIAKGFYEADSVMKAWIKSPGHCNNLINGAFQEMSAVFIRQGGVGCQSFGAATPAQALKFTAGISHKHPDKAVSFIVVLKGVKPTDQQKVWVQMNGVAKSLSQLMQGPNNEAIYSATFSAGDFCKLVNCAAGITYLFGATINTQRLRLPVDFPQRYQMTY